MLIRREAESDVDAVAEVTTAAFGKDAEGEPVETRLLAELRRDPAWVPELSLVAVADDGRVVGHVVCTRARSGASPALGLGPISVHPEHQGQGVGSALMHAVLGAAEALGAPAVVLLGEPGYYSRFGFVAAAELGIRPPVADWEPYFQVRPLAGWSPSLRGEFTYADPFTRAT
jgi:putative acetyltransferase